MTLSLFKTQYTVIQTLQEQFTHICRIFSSVEIYTFFGEDIHSCTAVSLHREIVLNLITLTHVSCDCERTDHSEQVWNPNISQNWAGRAREQWTKDIQWNSSSFSTFRFIIYIQVQYGKEDQRTPPMDVDILKP